MPLRLLSAAVKKNDEPLVQPSPEDRQSFWRTGLLLVTSAALGGIAVAVWNRRTLALMRQQIDPPNPSQD